MPTTDVTFYFARLHLMGNYTDKAAYLMRSFNSGSIEEKRGFSWGFFNISRVMFNDHDFIMGYLVKYKRSDEQEVVDVPRRELRVQSIDNPAIASSPFLLHPKSGVLAFHAIEGKIGHQQFRTVFARLLERGQEDMFVDADVSFITRREELFTALRAFEKVTKLSITLFPSNPRFADRWQSIDERIRRVHASKYQQTYANEQGLDPDGVQAVAEPDILMASDGYGSAEIRGVRDGRKARASTQEIPLTETVEQMSTTPLTLEQLLTAFESIWGRMDED